MDFKDSFKKNLKTAKKGLEVSSNPSSLFESLSTELQAEIESNKVLQFKKSLRENLKEIKQNKSAFNLFDVLPEATTIEEQMVQEEIVESLETIEEKTNISKSLILDAVDSITRQELSKPKEENLSEYTNLFSQPNSKIETSDIKALQRKLKSLEDWVTKISMTGPGGGEVNFRWLDDVDRSTIGNTDQILRYDPDTKKFFFGQLSGDQGPIRSLEFDVNGAGIDPSPQMLEWNTAKDCLNIHQNDNTTLQVGLENYIRVHNISGNTITNGTFVQFSGVNGDNETPTCVPFIANTSSVPLYSIGLLTVDIENGGYGRATVLGEVRDLNTTGSDVSELWQEGDLLWANPLFPGKLTKVKPTAPDVVISVAAVMRVDSTQGILLCRPVIFPRLYYGSFFDTTDQTVTSQQLNSPREIRYSNTQISSGFHISNNSQIVAENAGLYNYQFSLQIDSTNASSSQNIWIWYRKNGEDVPATASRLTVDRDYKVVAWNFIESMEIGEYFQLMWATDSVNVRLHAPPATAFCPSIPSVILTVTQVNL